MSTFSSTSPLPPPKHRQGGPNMLLLAPFRDQNHYNKKHYNNQNSKNIGSIKHNSYGTKITMSPRVSVVSLC